jgi:hypothetical protein
MWWDFCVQIMKINLLKIEKFIKDNWFKLAILAVILVGFILLFIALTVDKDKSISASATNATSSEEYNAELLTYKNTYIAQCTANTNYIYDQQSASLTASDTDKVKQQCASGQMEPFSPSSPLYCFSSGMLVELEPDAYVDQCVQYKIDQLTK